MAVLLAVVVLATVGLDVATAGAAPPPAPVPAASCSYTLTSPSKVDVSGTDMVTATLTHGPCTGEITPNSMTVCIELRGYTPPQCNFHPTFDPVQVFFTPYRSGGTYLATGRGCGNVFPMADESCSSLGPYTKTL
ncbi:MAG: hypothetical protein ACRDUX_21260 [Mycobacterium sp.]